MDTGSMWHPWQEMRRLQQEMENVFADVTPAWRWPLTGEYPLLNIWRGDNGIRVDALCPGADRSSFDITVVGDSVTLRGERKPDPNVPESRYQRRERPLGPFTRTVSFGERLDGDRTQATYTNGILRLELARAPEATPKRVQIQT